MSDTQSPTSSRDFMKAALQRLTTAEFLLNSDFNLDAMYLGRYAIECSLKALILDLTKPADRASTLKKIRQRIPAREDCVRMKARSLPLTLPINRPKSDVLELAQAPPPF